MTADFDIRFLKDILKHHPLPQSPSGKIFHSATVLMPLFEEDADVNLLAILKSDNKGYPWRNQVALPGGHVDAEDENSLSAAYREIEEELNIGESQLELIGTLGHFETIRYTEIEAFVAFWSGEKSQLVCDPTEISKILEIPLRVLIETHVNKQFEDRIPSIAELIYPSGDDQVVIWGVTARIIHFFLEHIRGLAPELFRTNLRRVQ